MKPLGIIFAVSGLAAVLLGAFGAHGLQHLLDEKSLDWWNTASSYHFYHTLALGLLVALNQTIKPFWSRLSAVFFCLGIILFCGSLYLLALNGYRTLAWVTPVGGLCFLLGWSAVAIGFWRSD